MPLIDFVAEDAPRTLFPLFGPTIVIARAQHDLTTYISEELFSKADYHPHFVQAPVAFALKDRLHTRRVHVLDPIATLYLYDFVFRHAALFKAPTKDLAKRRYGYHMKAKMPISASEEHQQFRQRILALKRQYRYVAKLDVSNCFSSFYHHDIVSALMRNVESNEAERFGKFLREINGGRSTSCFPQGLFPTKALGNLFLSFIEQSVDIHCPAVIRYLDDVFMFSDSRPALESDVYRLQIMLSERNMYLNSAKTTVGTTAQSMQLPKTNLIRKRLLAKRAAAIEAAYDDDPETVQLSKSEYSYLSGLIGGQNVAEGDVELALALITEDGAHAENLANLVFEQYPHLIKSLYAHLKNAAYEGPDLWKLLEASASNPQTHEFALFWCVRILLDLFKWSEYSAKLLIKLYDHPRTTDVVRAAILESNFIDFGLLDHKESALRNSGSNLLAISAAVGLRQLDTGRRNKLYKYAAATSPLMYQVTQALQKPAAVIEASLFASP